MPFKWQINASAVSKLLGYFGKDRQHQAIAETWHMNLKRMPRFGVQPSVLPSRPTVEAIVKQEIANTVEYKTLVKAGVDRSVHQQQAVANMQVIATNKAVHCMEEANKAERAVKRAKTVCFIRMYPKIASGLRKTRINGFFAVNGKIYHKKSTKCAKLTTASHASSEGWKSPAVAVKATAVAVEKAQIWSKKAAVAQTVQKNIVKLAHKQINTTRGTQSEATDLERVQRKYPSVVSGNNQAKFLHVDKGSGLYAGFVIGKIDGYDDTTGTIYELKHRRSRLFHELRRYEQVQCLLYLVMFKKSRLTLVETHLDKQMYYPMEFYNGILKHNGQEMLKWSTICTGLAEIVSLLNKAEVNEEYRNILLEKI